MRGGIDERKNTIYVGIGPEKGTVVEEGQAYEYALERCSHGTREDVNDFKEMLVEWFYTGNWLKKGKENE